MACEKKHSPDKRSPVRELSGTGEAPGCGDENVSSRNERKKQVSITEISLHHCTASKQQSIRRILSLPVPKRSMLGVASGLGAAGASGADSNKSKAKNTTHL